MDKDKIIEIAQGVTNGDKLIIKYRKPADVMQKRTFERNKLEAKLATQYKKDSDEYKEALKEGKKSLIKMNEGGRDPVIKLYKISSYELIYDERDYFRQMIEEQAQNLYPEKQKSDYNKIQGVLYEKAEGKDKGKLYIRYAIRADRIKTTSLYSSDQAGKSEKKYEDIEEFLQAGAKRDYSCYNRQMGITSTGKVPDVEIRQASLDLDRILSIKVIKPH